MVEERSNLLLLDTPVWLWFVLGDAQLPGHVREQVEYAASQGRLYLSIMSVWEVADLVAQKRLTLKKPCTTWVQEAIDRSGIQVVALTPDIAVESCQLPQSIAALGIPSRIVIATARSIGAQLVANNPGIVDKANERYVEVIAA